MSKFFSTKTKDSIRQILTKLRGEGVGAVLARGAGASFIIKICGTGIAFVTQIFLARVMGTEQYGIYIYVVTWLNILVLIAKMGWDTLLLRYIAKYETQAEWGTLRGILETSNRFALIGSFTVSISVALVVWMLKEQLNSELALTFWIGCGLVPLLTLTRLRQTALQALKRISLAQLPELILRQLFLAIFICFLSIALSQQVNASTAISLDILALSICFLLSSYWLNNSLPKPVATAISTYHNREWFITALPLFLISGMHMILNYTDTLMLGVILGSTKAGIYTVVSRISTLITFGLGAVNAIAAPIISQLYTSGKHSELQKIVTLAARGIFIFSFPIALLLILFGYKVLALFGSEFIQGYEALKILALGQLVNALAGSVGILMTMTGHQREAALVIGTSAMLNILLNAWFIPLWGVTGAAVATTLTIAMWNIALAFFVWKRLNLRATIL